MSVLNKNITQFKKSTAKTGETVNLLNWLNDDTRQKEIERIRSLDPEARRAAKKNLPTITPSGTFSHRAESGLIEHSGLIQFDIDDINDTVALKAAIAEIPFVAYCGLSTSGRGLWGLIPIQHPDQHKQHFRALQAAFADMGVTIDSKPQNVASLRFASYDPESYFNHDAEPFHYLEDMPEPSLATVSSEELSLGESSSEKPDTEKVVACIDQIEQHQIDITGGYETWFPIGTGFIRYGDQGKDWFHRISRYSPKYNPDDLNNQWEQWNRAGASADIGTFFNACKDHGILFKNGGINPAPFGFNPWTNEVFDQRGYPSEWDNIGVSNPHCPT